MPNRPIRFAGYASVFDVPDADRDTVRRGAFVRSLNARTGPVPLLWQHRANEQVGVIESLSEDSRGLRVIGRIERLSSRAAKLVAQRKIDGLSFGYRAREVRQSEAGRELLSLDLFEVSLVTHPLQHSARVHLVT